MSYSKSDGALGNFTASRKTWLIRIKVHLPSTQGLLTRFGTMDTTSPGLGQEEQGGLPRVGPLGQRAWASRSITEAV
jgi:hypothetical protein